MRTNVKSNASALAARNRRRAAALPVEINKGLQIAKQPIMAQARAVSMGQVPGAIFRVPLSKGGLAHPYGYGALGSLGPRGSQPYGNLPIINFQRGVFEGAWGAETKVIGDIALLRLYNTSEWAKALNYGTPVMKARNFIAYIHLKQDRGFTLTIRAAFQRAWKTP